MGSSPRKCREGFHGKDQRAFRDCQDIPDPFGRHGGIHGTVGETGFDAGGHTDLHEGMFVSVYYDHRLSSGGFLVQICRKPVRVRFEPGIVQGVAAAPAGQTVRICGRVMSDLCKNVHRTRCPLQ